MGWGGGWGNHSPQTARDVAEAFYAGKTRKRSNCHTDGQTYWLEGNPIAWRIPDDQMADEVERAMFGKVVRRPLEFSFTGWTTEMTCRHLQALGLDAQIHTDWETGPRGGRGNSFYVATLNGRAVQSTVRYTLEELAQMPKWEPSFKPRAVVWVPPCDERQLTMVFA